ncbi:MAG: Mu transposase domain-containing protein [Acetobacteraceae bacterium]
MLDDATRTTILTLKASGHGTRAIGKALRVARSSVRRVLASGATAPPPILRTELAEPHREMILELYARFKGHLGRVHEALTARGVELSYPALTAFCRKHGIGAPPPPPAGHYEFAAACEMQHDTSPHWAKIDGRLTRVQTASLVLCYSRMIFFQHYPRFTRFHCKAFLTQAICYFGGAATQCMIDNTHVIVAAGTGAAMIPAPEMAAFAERYGFVFKAHALGHANRSARVEAPFHRIETAFLAGGEFADWSDLNARARERAEQWNAAYSNKLHASRRELFAAEQPRLVPLPLHVPEVYQLHTRIVDAEGYVHLNRIRYSAPWRLIGRVLEVRETLDQVDLYDGPRRVATHERVWSPWDTRVTDPTHRPPRGELAQHRAQPAPEALEIVQAEPRMAAYLCGLKHQIGDRRAPLRRLLAMLQEYPREPFLAAVVLAEQYRLFDLDRLERMVLREIAHEYFVLDPGSERADD